MEKEERNNLNKEDWHSIIFIVQFLKERICKMITNIDEQTFNFLKELKKKKSEENKKYRIIVIYMTSCLNTYSFFVLDCETSGNYIMASPF